MRVQIDNKLGEIKERWAAERFSFAEWKGRNVPVLMGVVPVVEELEEAQMQLQTMLTMRHVTPFRDEVQSKLKQLSDTSEALELWLKVQMLWCSLESVFLGGDIAKQMPVVAKKFVKIDKDWSKIMSKAAETMEVVACCANELLRTSLPVMYSELEKCQKSLEGYLEQKRNKFPRFYFVSNPVLLQVLSQGSDPQSVQAYYEKIFDAVSCVEHDKKDPNLIMTIISRAGSDEERVPLQRKVKCVGNIEDWLNDLIVESNRTMKEICADCSAEVRSIVSDVGQLRGFVNKYCGQFSLLGIQLLWTFDVQSSLDGIKSKKNTVRARARCLQCSAARRLMVVCFFADAGLRPASGADPDVSVRVVPDRPRVAAEPHKN